MDADEELLQQLRALFAEEVADGLRLLVPGLLSLEERAGSAASGELVRELFRTAHSLKGAAHAAAVPQALAACDRLESALAAVRDGRRAADAALVSRLLDETDAVAASVAALGQTAPPSPRPAAAPPSAPPAAPASAPESAPTPGPAAGDRPQRPPGRTGGSGVPAPARVRGAVTPSPPGPGALPARADGPAPSRAPVPTLRVTTDKVDAVLRHAGEGLATARRLHDVAQQAAQAADQVEAARSRLHSARRAGRPDATAQASVLLDEAARAVTALARTLEVTDRALHHATSGSAEAVQRLRTQPFADACRSLDRVVRDIATSTGKSARLTVVGEDIDVDRSVIAALRDPLLHLVRNAVDHGLEAPGDRERAGKPATGTVAVEATLVGSLLHVAVRDDGAGIDLAALREAAADRGIAVPVEETELAFVPGLSSRPEVTAVSGRGVGLDAARARLEELGGSLQVTSRPGAGTEVRLTAPVNLAVLRVLLVRAAGQVVALPTSSLDRVLQVERRALRPVDGQVLLSLGSRSVRAVPLADALGFAPDPEAEGAGEVLGVVLPRTGDAALVTDGLLDELEVAVQPVPDRLAGAPGVVGVTVTPAGRPAVVVNPAAVGRHASAAALSTSPPPEAAPVRILLAEDTVTTRALERSILEAAGYSVTVAVDGADAWQQLQADGADLVVSDVDMPRMSGIDLCRRIRSSAALREVPVVLVTSLDSAADRQRGLEAGADAYVGKAQLHQGALLDTIARLL